MWFARTGGACRQLWLVSMPLCFACQSNLYTITAPNKWWFIHWSYIMYILHEDKIEKCFTRKRKFSTWPQTSIDLWRLLTNWRTSIIISRKTNLKWVLWNEQHPIGGTTEWLAFYEAMDKSQDDWWGHQGHVKVWIELLSLVGFYWV